MQFTESVIALIKKRRAWRTYQPKPLEPKVREALEVHLSEKRKGPFAKETRFQLISWEATNSVKAERVGTYGTITGATSYIIGAVKRGERCLENFGYLMEETILYATNLGLGTCWLGGSLQRADLMKKIAAKPDEYIPAMTPVGEIARKRGLQDRILCWSAGSENRKPWKELFFEGQFFQVLEEAAAGKYATVLEMVRLGPSASNRQPWRIVKEKAHPIFHFYLQRNPLYGQLAKSLLQAEDIQRLDMGVAMCHFEKTAQELNLKGSWKSKTPALADVPDKTEYIVSWVGEST